MQISSSHKNLKLLWWLRNVAIAGQAAAIFTAHRYFNLSLPALPLWLIVAALALLWLYVVRLFQDYVVNPHLAVQTVGLSPLVTLVSVAVVGILFGGFAVILAVPVTSAVASLIDVLVLGHEPPTARPRRSLRLPRSE